MAKIDAFHHFWQYNPEKHTWIDDDMSVLKQNYMPSDLKHELDNIVNDGSIAVQGDQSE